MTISQRIFALLKQKGKKQKELSEYTGISTSAISAWNKNNTNPTADSLSTIADFLGVSLDYLLTGEEKINENTEDIKKLLKNYNLVDDISKQLIQERAATLAELAAERAAQEAEKAAKKEKTQPSIAEKPNTVEADPQEPEECRITYYDYPASAGTGLFLDEAVAEEKYIKPTSEAFYADYAIPVSGDSMEPEFSSGDTVLVESCPNVAQGKVGIFVLDGDVYIKEYGGDCLISYNEEYPPIMLKDFDTAVCLGRVLGKAEIIE